MDFNILYQYIPVGMENAIHQKDLAEKLGVTPDAAKQIIRKARQQGLEILSGIEGYYFAASEQEKEAFAQMMQKQAFSRLKTASPIIKTLKQVKGQLSLKDCIEGAFDEVAGNGE